MQSKTALLNMHARYCTFFLNFVFTLSLVPTTDDFLKIKRTMLHINDVQLKPINFANQCHPHQLNK